MKQQAVSVLDALGVHLPPSGDLTVRSPIDGGVLAQIPTASRGDMQAALKDLRRQCPLVKWLGSYPVARK